MRKIFAVAALLSSSQLIAQTDTTGQSLNEVVVTANKYPNKTSLTGKVVTIINRQDIERAGSRDLSQLLTEQGGIYINGSNSNLGKDKSVYVRGGRVEHTLITIDGVPVYDASGIGSNFDIRNISIDQVERVEILKGSQSTLYGSDAIAGVINIITRKNGTKPISGYGAFHHGSFNTKRANVGANGKLKNFDYSVGYSYVNTDGISEAEQPANPPEAFDKDGFEQNAVQANFGIQASRLLAVKPYIRYTQNEGGYDADGFTDGKGYYFTVKNLQAGVRNELTLGSGKLNVIYNYNNLDRGYQTPFSPSTYQSNEHYGEAFVVFPFNRLTLTSGVDFRNSSTDQTTSFSALSSDSVKHSQVGAYAALNFNAGNGLNVEGGGRYNHHSEYGSHFAFNLNPSYLIQNQWKLFANLSSGYKTPGLYQLFSNIGNRNLDPENSINVEGGLQFFTKDEKANIRATYFNRTINDVIIYGYNMVLGRAQYINQNKQNDYGFELEGKWNITNQLQAKVLYAYVDGEVTAQVGSKDTTYYNLHRRPQSQLNVSLGSQITKALYVSAQANAFGKNKDFSFSMTPPYQTEVTLDNYVLLNFYAEYAFLKNRIKVFADLRNLGDVEYNEIYGYNAPGFNGYGGFRFNF
jgi:vitamin B12 transporter